METHVEEIADRIFRLSTFVPEIGPTGFTFNQFLVDDGAPLLFHTGGREMFPSVSAAIATVMPIDKLRWITFGHLESDECGAMNLFLQAAPGATIAHTGLGCMVSINDLADRAPEPMGPDTVLELGTKRIRNIDTPHVPHGWDAHVLYEETTGTLLCGDLFTHFGNGPALTDGDILDAAALAEDVFGATCLTPNTAPTIRSLAGLEPKVLALMHGSSYNGECSKALLALADDYDRRLTA